jgi:hypothetical protein
MQSPAYDGSKYIGKGEGQDDTGLDAILKVLQFQKRGEVIILFGIKAKGKISSKSKYRAV